MGNPITKIMHERYKLTSDSVFVSIFSSRIGNDLTPAVNVMMVMTMITTMNMMMMIIRRSRRKREGIVGE